MYNTLNDFISDWKTESDKTISLFENLTDDSLSRKVYDEGRSLGYLAWHIVLTIGEMLGQTGLQTDCPKDGSPEPATAQEIIDAYKSSASSVLDVLPKQWTDASLSEQVQAYGQMWTKESILISLVRHQIHHRAQMTVVMRQAGLPIPGLYGPAKEDWAKYGMDTHK
jgi:uncharacterized damage-inducible protein DinB